MKLLRKLTEQFKVSRKGAETTQGDLIAYLLDMCNVHNLIKEGWMDRLTGALKRGDWKTEDKMMKNDTDRCPAMTHGEEKFKCVWGRKGKPPMIRLLEKDYSLSKNGCVSCVKTMLLVTDKEEYEKKIKYLESKLQAKSEIELKVPVCEAVGVLNGDGTLFSRCQEHNMRAVNIEKFCKVKNNGEPCDWYMESIVGVAEIIK